MKTSFGHIVLIPLLFSSSFAAKDKDGKGKERADTNSGSGETCPDEEPEIEYYCPIVRYCEWDSQGDGNKDVISTGIGYRDRDWNYFEINPVESTYFMGLDEKVRENLEVLGFDEDKHDCCHGHYNDYDWADFDPTFGYGPVVGALELLGYNESNWDDETFVPEFDDYWWDELPLKVQWSVYDWLCYSRELWDEVPTPSWNSTAEIPGSFFTEGYDDYYYLYYDDDDNGEALNATLNATSSEVLNTTSDPSFEEVSTEEVSTEEVSTEEDSTEEVSTEEDSTEEVSIEEESTEEETTEEEPAEETQQNQLL